jgi:hypothetical protein
LIVVNGLGSNDSSSEALFHHSTIIIEEDETPHTDTVALSELTNGDRGKDKVPDKRLEETLISSLDKFHHHF